MALINCHVRECRHNKQGQSCTLSSITVGNTAPNANCCEDTECDSFED